jgi:TPR repeat protein
MRTYLLIMTMSAFSIFANKDMSHEDEMFFDAKERVAIGERYAWGTGVELNYETARKYFEAVLKMAEFNPVAATRAECWLTMIDYIYCPNPNDPLLPSLRARFEKSAEQSLDYEAKIYALLRLGVMAMYGEGQEIDVAKAKYYFEQVGKLGAGINWQSVRGAAELCLGVLIFNGVDKKPDCVRARDYIIRNLESVNAHHRMQGTLTLGKMLMQGVGGKKDVVLAIKCFEEVINSTEELIVFWPYWSDTFKLFYVEANAYLGLFYTQGMFWNKNLLLAKQHLVAARTNILFARLDNKIKQQVESAYNKYCCE